MTTPLGYRVVAYTAGTGALASWAPLEIMLGGFAVVVITLIVLGRAGNQHSRVGAGLQRVPNGLERVTGIPGWAAAAVGTSMFGLVVAGQGFYADVAWHVAYGRDKTLFTPPHTGIVIGLLLIAGGAVLGVLFASLGRVDTALRWRSLRVPWSMLPLGALGFAAVSGFPLDDRWHAHYGIDVTMWSPTHMLMILGASFSGMACWLALAEAGVKPTDGAWARTAHVLAAALTLMGLTSSQGEFNFGVPQFQQLFLPVLIAVAAGFALVAGRIVLGRGWMLGIAVVTFAMNAGHVLGGSHGVVTRPGGMYIASAAVVEVVAWLAGTDRRLRFALLSGLGVATLGFAGEWAWNAHAYQPWHLPLLRDALVLGAVVAIASAVVGAAFAGAIRREGRRVPIAAVVAGALAVLVGLALPMPRRVGNVTAAVHVAPAPGGRAVVTAMLEPPNAAAHARWFQALSWQGGTMVAANMRRVGPGRYVSERPVPVTGRSKAVLRLHRGAEMMAVPIRLPADPAIGKAEIPAVDRTTRFVNERHYLLREQHAGSAWFAILIYVLLSIVAFVWAAAFLLAASRIGRQADVSGTGRFEVQGSEPRRVAAAQA
ncbi:MAG: hypothetical protein E6G17_09380 [Actinobacteria bacterium]|nr:MAG: hypothetical protein E6G17_09380 [Actinomycetota bacterium]